MNETEPQPSPPPTMTRTVVVGGGLSGLTAADHLAQALDGTGSEILVVERAKSVGGRLATRQLGSAQLDTGAQFFTVRSDEFAETVEWWTAQGWVEEWCRGFDQPPDGYPRYRAVGGMRALAHNLGAELAEHPSVTVVTKATAAAVVPGRQQVSVTYDAWTREPDEADAVILTPPLPISLSILDAGPIPIAAELASALRAADYHRVIAVLAVLDRPADLPPPGARQQPDDPTFSFVADNQAKAISPTPAVTFHLAHSLSAELWDADDATIMARIHASIRDVTGSARVEQIQIRRWRHAGPVTPFDRPCDVIQTEPAVVLAGDAYAGAKVEGAFRSGMAAARAVLSASG